MAAYTTDPDGRLTAYNAAAVELWGWHPPLGEVRWCGAWRLLHPDGSPMAPEQAPMAVALREGRALPGVAVLAERPDGSRLPLLACPAPLRDAAGAVAGGIGLLVPPEAGGVGADGFMLSAEHVRDIVLLLDREGRILGANAAAVAAYGHDRAALRRMSIHDLRAPETLPAIPEQMARAEHGGVLFETLHRRADGSTFPVEVSSAGVDLAGGRMLISVVRDITGRKRAEHALAETAARLQVTLDAGGMGGWEVNLATRARTRDAQMLALCGLPPDTPSDQGEAFDALLHPEDRPQREAALRRALAEGGEYRCEFRIRRADTGEERWLAARGKVLPGPDGRPERLVGVNFDITERKRAEAALRESEARLRIALEAGRMAVWERDIVADTIRTSPELNRLFGFPPEAAPGTEEIRARYWPGERARMRRVALAAIARGDRFAEVEFRIVRLDGAVRWLMIRAEIQRDAAGDAVRMIGVVFDVTERKRAEQALRESEERLRVALAAARMATWEYDVRSGLAARSGDLVGDRPGLPRERFTLPDWLAQMHPEDRPALECAIADAVAGRQEHFAVEYRLRRPGPGETRWMWLATHGAIVERDPGTGEVLRLAGVALDISDRKEAEERQRLLMREVDHRAKNALAVVQAAVRLTPREDAVAFASAVEGRVAALARAHSLLAEERWSGVGLRTLAEAELAAFLHMLSDDGAPRVTVDGPELSLTPAAAQALSMALHELATNATRHGALSVPQGRIALSWRVEEEPALLRLRWEERGGPPVAGSPARRGFGSRVIEATVRDQLGGRVERHWGAEGLVCQLAVPLGRAVVPDPPLPHDSSPQEDPAAAEEA